MTDERGIFILLAAAAGVGAAISGSGVVMAIFGLLLACAASGALRQRLSGLCTDIWSRAPWRATLVVLGALLLWQLVGVELALLMAGDILLYVEVLVAVNLFAARTRWGPVAQAIARRVRTAVMQTGTRLSRRVAGRTPRRHRPRRPQTPVDDGPWGVPAVA
jgi:hypothetical protein